MPKDDLLPGVTVTVVPPIVSCDSRRAIRSARRHAVAREAAQLLLLVGVDVLFIRWPAAHVPMLDRYDSLIAVAVLNAAVITNLVMSRMAPKLRAKRIAATWCPAEQNRLKK